MSQPCLEYLRSKGEEFVTVDWMISMPVPKINLENMEEVWGPSFPAICFLKCKRSLEFLHIIVFRFSSSVSLYSKSESISFHSSFYFLLQQPHKPVSLFPSNDYLTSTQCPLIKWSMILSIYNHSFSSSHSLYTLWAIFQKGR